MNVPGTYQVEYTYVDLAGNSHATTRTVVVIDTTAPLVSILESAAVTVEFGSTYSDP